MVNKEPRGRENEWAKSEKQEVQSVRILATTENRTGMLAGITNAPEIKTGISRRSAYCVKRKSRLD